MKNFKKILGGLIIGLIIFPSILLILPHKAEAALSWTGTPDPKIATTTVPDQVGNDILVTFSGMGVDLAGAEAWTSALVDKDLKEKGVGVVYAVAGPNTDTYDVKNNPKEVKIGIDLVLADILKPGVWQSGARVIIIDHSSGVYLVKEFIKEIQTYNDHKKNGEPYFSTALTFIYNLDGNVSIKPDASAAAILSYDVYSSSKSDPSKLSYYANQATTPKINVSINTATPSCILTGSTINQCLHMRLVNTNSTQGFKKVNDDYKATTSLNVQTDYLSGISNNKAIKVSPLQCTILDDGTKVIPNNKQQPGWYVEKTSKLLFVVETEHCAGKQIGFSMFEADTMIGSLADNKINIRNLSSEILMAPSDRFIIEITAGEEYCEIGPGKDCHIYFKLTNEIDKNNANYKIFNSTGKPSGDLFYECDGTCFDIFIYNGIRENTLPKGQDPVVASAIDTSKPYNGDYTLLAPIGNTTKIDAKTTIGDYLNLIFKIGIGLLIALSVIMLVVHGIQYMGDESIFGKTEAMSSIRATIGGLLLALGAYAILNTINPDLVKGNLSVNSITFEVSQDIPQVAPTKGNTYTGTAYKTGDVWPAEDANMRARLKGLGINVDKGPCTTVGQAFTCTSLYKLDTSVVERIKTDCGNSCVVNITEGTGFWFHYANNKKIHYPDGWSVDLQKTPSLTGWLHSKTKVSIPWTTDSAGKVHYADCYTYGVADMGIVEESDHFHTMSRTGGCDLNKQGL